MKKYSIVRYVSTVVIILAIVNFIAWSHGMGRSVSIFSLGFFLGMLAMFIAVHLYRWK